MKVVFRVDSSSDIGWGHAIRCLSLAHAWRESGAEIRFLCRRATGSAESEISSYFPIDHLHDSVVGQEADARESSRLAKEPDWFVVDHYALDQTWENHVRVTGSKVLAIDDVGRPHSCSAVLDQNLSSRVADYEGSVDSRCRLMIGPSFALLRPEFRELRGSTPPRSTLRRLLVSLGGTCPENLLLSIADALAETKIADLELTCLLGKRGLASEPIRLAFAQIPGKIRLLESSDKMAELMAEADVMIGAAGSSSWERCCLGVPSLLVTIASNQEGIGRELQRRGMALNLGLTENLSAEDITAALRRLIDSPTSLKAMSVAASDLVDGDGAKRVVKLLSAPSIDLRSVNEGDCQQIFDWSNDPDVRANSFSTAPIPWADHERWFAKRLQDQNCTFYIGTLAKEAAGQVRFEREDQIAIISVSLDSKMRGRGIAAELLRSATQRFLMENTDCQVLAYIRPENIGSIRAFSGAGYLSDGTAMVGDSSCLRYRYPA